MNKILYSLLFFFLSSNMVIASSRYVDSDSYIDSDSNVATPTDFSKPVELRKLLDVNNIARLAKKEAKTSKTLRIKALKEAAQTLGVDGGYRYRYGLIFKSIEPLIPKLDNIYNFDGYLMHRGKVLPPIIAVAGPAARKENANELVFSQKTFQIIKDSEVILNKPNWRTYLKTPANNPPEIHPSLYPVTFSEQEIWKKEVENGWNMGIEQADLIFNITLNKLTRDILGLINFRVLALQRIVSRPFLATGRSSTEISEKGKKLQIGKTTYRLVNDPAFQTDKQWVVKTTTIKKSN